MKHLGVLTLVVFVLLTAIVLFAGCTSVPPDTKPVPPVSPVTTAPVPSGSSCGITSCHGLDLACGANPPEVCTMEYRLGDKCRQYARCDSSGGSCTLVTDPQFAPCKACVEQCAARETADPAAAFDCEAKC